MTDAGRDFRKQFSVRVTPGFVLLNSSGKELWQYIGIPNSTKFIEQINQVIKQANV
tara:strand:+ start:1532 stop:1699 length:168 start_codon:yes stop_codon:yes gene_type:complete